MKKELFREYSQKELKEHAIESFNHLRSYCESEVMAADGYVKVAIEPDWSHKRHGEGRFLKAVGLPPSTSHYLKRKDANIGFVSDNVTWELHASEMNVVNEAVKKAMKASGDDVFEAVDILNERKVFSPSSPKWNANRLANFLYTNPVTRTEYRVALKDFARKS